MTQVPQQTVQVKPQADIYTLLIIVAVLVLAATIGVVMWNLMTAYGLSFGDMFKPLPESL